jgi:membrane dipeptidase
MVPTRLAASFTLALILVLPTPAPADDPLPPVSERARKVHDAGLLFDGHNDLPYALRKKAGLGFETVDLSQPVKGLQTDIPRMRKGGLKAQFWSVFIGSDQPHPARTVVEQIDLVRRMAARYPADLEMAYTASDVERIAASGKVASLVGIEGGVAIENDLAMLRAFYELGARYMTLTHNKTLDWVDAATGEARHHGLTPFGERVVREMNRLGMLVDISHVSPETMDDVLRVSQAPIIASHSSAKALAPHPRNVPDDILRRIKTNGGVVMVNFFSEFVIPGSAAKVVKAREELKARHPDAKEFDKAFAAWSKANHLPRGTVADVVDHVDHIVKVAGIDHVGLGSDFDGITMWPVGLDDVSDYPRITEELLRRGYSEADVHKVLGANAVRALRDAGKVAERLRKTTKPDVGTLKDEPFH